MHEGGPRPRFWNKANQEISCIWNLHVMGSGWISTPNQAETLEELWRNNQHLLSFRETQWFWFYQTVHYLDEVYTKNRTSEEDPSVNFPTHAGVMKMTRFKDEHHAEVTSWSSCLPACRCAGVADHLHADAGRRRRNTKAAAAACRGRRASSPAEPLFFGSLSFAFSHQTVLLSFIYTKEVSHVGTATVWHRSAIQDEALTVAQICIVSSVHNHPPTTTTTFPSAPPPPAEPASPVREPPPVYTLHTTFCTNQSGAGAGRQTWKAHSYNRGSIGLAPSRRRPERPARGGGAVGHPLKCGGMVPEEGPHKQQPRPRYPPPPPTEAHHSVQSLCWKLRRSGGVMRSRDAAECLQAQVSEQAKGQTTHPPWPGPPIARCGPSSFSLKQWAEGFAWKVILHLGPAGMLVTMDTRGGWRWSLRLGPYLNTKACLDPPSHHYHHPKKPTNTDVRQVKLCRHRSSSPPPPWGAMQHSGWTLRSWRLPSGCQLGSERSCTSAEHAGDRWGESGRRACKDLLTFDLTLVFRENFFVLLALI